MVVRVEVVDVRLQLDGAAAVDDKVRREPLELRRVKVPRDNVLLVV